MRLLIVTETYPPEINGVAMTTGRMVAGLRARGHWVGLVRPWRERNDSVGESEWTVPGLPLPNYPGVKLGLPAWRRLTGLMRSQDPDLVHIVTEGPLGWAALFAARRLGLPVTSGYHTHFDQYSSHYGLGWLAPMVTRFLDALHRRCRATLVPSADLATVLTVRGIPNVQVVGRGVDTGLFNPGRRSPELRRAWGVDNEADLVCLHVGRLAPEKNLNLVVRAYEAIRYTRPEARMVWVGDGPALPQLRAVHPGHIFAGPRMGEDLARHYASADLFLFASLSETWGNVLGEAMASGLGVVAYRRAAAASLVQHGENGMSPAPGDEVGFIASARLLAGDGDLRRRLGRQASLDLSRHDWESILDQLENALEQAARQRPVPVES